MFEQQAEEPAPPLSAGDDAYLSELNHRLSQLRSLHKHMSKSQDSWNWLKVWNEQG